MPASNRSSNSRLRLECLEPRRCLSGLSFLQREVDESEIIADFSQPLAVEDIDGDDDVDILFAADAIKGTASRLGWYENTDAGNEFRIHTLSIDSHVRDLALADLNGDGALDVIYAGKTVGWLKNTDAETRFDVEYTVQGLGGTSLFDVVDVNGDGALDLVTASARGRLAWSENDGSGSFFESQLLSVGRDGSYLQSLRTADVDGDGDFDIIVAERRSVQSPFEIYWHENRDGNGNFSAPRHIARGEDVLPTDVDGDGDVDLLFQDSPDMGWYENIDSRGTFSPVRRVIGRSSGLSLLAHDVDHDGDVDVLAGAHLYSNIGEGRFELARSFDFAGAVVLEDMDQDGDTDIVSRGPDSITWHANDGRGQFASFHAITTGLARPVSVQSADMDQDGDLDIVTATLNDGKIAWYENTDGNGGFGQRRVVDQRKHATSIHAVDVDQDGDQDLVATFGTALGLSVWEPHILWYENVDGLGEFGGATPIGRTVDELDGFDGEAHIISVADLDSDGDVDILSSSNWPAGGIRWFENTNGGGQFVQHVITEEYAANQLLVSDLDLDGAQDIIVLNHRGNVGWMRNLDGRTFGALNLLTEEEHRGIYSIGAHDLDLDGDTDLLLAEERSVSDHTVNEIAWIENAGDGSFLERRVVARLGAHQLFQSDLVTVDLDEDGDLDILAATGDHPATLSWYENLDGKGNYAEANQLLSMTDTFRYSTVHVVSPGDLDGDGDIDIAVVAPGDSRIVWLEQRVVGDVNGDGRFDSSDLVAIFQAGEYEDGITNNSDFEDGDWNGDGEFDSSDLVAAFQAGTYVAG